MTRPHRTAAIVQSSYIPWKGYFDLIGLSDVFVFLDDAQYTRRDWRNRNRIKTAQGSVWLTIPVITKGLYSQSIEETRIASADWAERHWRAIETSYRRAAYFSDYAPTLEALYRQAGRESHLSAVNALFVEALCRMLGITTPLLWSRDLPHTGSKTERLLSLCQSVGATHYLSGPSAAGYLEVDRFAQAGISVSFMDYSGYPAYPQAFGDFDPAVSVIDLLFNTGPRAAAHMKWPGGCLGEKGT